jgi:hypothetical protein
MRYRHKPTKIEAFRWTGGPDQTEDPLWVIQAIRDGRISFANCGTGQPVYAEVETREGTMVAQQGWWIAKGIAGELYVIDPKLFDQLYEFDADEVVDMWAGNWIVTIEAPNGLVDSYYVDPQLVERSHMPAADMILGPAPAKVRELFDRRNEEKTDA